MSFERSVAPEKQEYYLLTINSDTTDPVVTRTFDEYHAKCLFHVPEVEYLGYVISARGLFMSQKKVSAVMDWEVPKSKVGVRVL